MVPRLSAHRSVLIVSRGRWRVWNYPRQLLGLGHRIEKSVAAANCFELQKTKDDNSFSRSLNAVKDAIPSSLKIMGNHNPLSILHDCLSDGVHNLSDEECLEMDQKARAALVALIERIALETELANSLLFLNAYTRVPAILFPRFTAFPRRFPAFSIPSRGLSTLVGEK
jgi:hypothetical protein